MRLAQVVRKFKALDLEKLTLRAHLISVSKLVFLALIICLQHLDALGQSYQESGEEEGTPVLWQEFFSSETTLTRRYQAQAWQRLIVDGEVNVTLVSGNQPALEVRGNRALLSQINVLSFNNVLFIKLNTSLLGPRERGRLTIHLTAPELKEVEVLNGVRFQGNLNGRESQRWLVRSESQVNLDANVPALDIEVTWGSRVQLRGTVEHLILKTRNSVSVDLRQLRIHELNIKTEGRAMMWVNELHHVYGILGYNSILNVPKQMLEQNFPELKVLGKIQSF